jgi:hypothetical protein
MEEAIASIPENDRFFFYPTASLFRKKVFNAL